MTKKETKKVTMTVTTDENGFPKYVSGNENITNEKTQIICILDRSGSMAEGGIIYESINGFNNFLEEQKKPKDEATITVALFDDRYELLYDDVDIRKVEKITYDIWYPRGTTALFDAIGKTINTVRAKHTTLGSNKPAKVLVCIVTDGKENASQEYTSRDKIKSLIKECEDDNWNFIYLAANQNAFDVGTSFGISGSNTYTYTADIDGVYNMSMTLNSASLSYRDMNSSSRDFKKKSKQLINNPNDNDKPEDDGTGNTSTSNTSNSFSIC
jgi:uncharacterized protein YegL